MRVVIARILLLLLVVVALIAIACIVYARECICIAANNVPAKRKLPSAARRPFVFRLSQIPSSAQFNEQRLLLARWADAKQKKTKWMKRSCGGPSLESVRCNYDFQFHFFFFSFRLFRPLEAISRRRCHTFFFFTFCRNDKDTHRGLNAIVKITSDDRVGFQWHGKSPTRNNFPLKSISTGTQIQRYLKITKKKSKNPIPKRQTTKREFVRC